MNLNLSASELNLLLSQLQQRLAELKSESSAEEQPATSSTNHRRLSPKTTVQVDRFQQQQRRSPQPIRAAIAMPSPAMLRVNEQTKATSLYNLDQIEQPQLIPRRDSRSHIFPGRSPPPPAPMAKSVGSLHRQDQSDWPPRAVGSNHWSTSSSSQQPNGPNCYRRFAHNANPEYTFESFWDKKRAAAAYREQLDQQVEEKRRQLAKSAMSARLEDALLDLKITEQQKHLKEEFDADHRGSARIVVADGSSSKDTLPVLGGKTGTTLQHNTWGPEPAGPRTMTRNTPEVKAPGGSSRSSPHNGTLAIPAAAAAPSTRSRASQTDDSLLFELIHEFMAYEAMHRNGGVAGSHLQVKPPPPQPAVNHKRTSTVITKRNKSIDRSNGRQGGTGASSKALSHRRK